MNATRWEWRRWAMLVAVLAVMAVISVAVAQAQQAPGVAGPCVRPQGLLTSDDRDAIGRVFLQRTKETLGLSDSQTDQVRTILQSRREGARADFQALCQARLNLRQLLQQNADADTLKGAGDQVKAVQGKLLDRRLDTVVALRNVLTPDQWAKWIELRKARGHRWMGRGPGLPL
jgi:Spy/CpxP family protein refolding chaperone